MSLPIILSKNKVEELKKELELLDNTLRKEQEANLGVVHGSYKEAAADEVVLKAKENRINEIKKILQKARTLNDGEIDRETGIGAEIEVTFPSGEKKKIKVVHPIEADPGKNLVSVDSPLVQEHLKK